MRHDGRWAVVMHLGDGTQRVVATAETRQRAEVIRALYAKQGFTCGVIPACDVAA